MDRNIPLKKFITEAERAWFRVFYSGKETKLRSRDGAPLATLPKRFCSCSKIRSFFQNYWGKRLAEQMLKNMPLAVRCGELFVIRYDPGPISTSVSKVQVLCQTAKTMIVLTTLRGGPERRVYVVHVLEKRKDRMPVIRLRIGPRYDYRYYPPQVSRIRRRRQWQKQPGH